MDRQLPHRKGTMKATSLPLLWLVLAGLLLPFAMARRVQSRSPALASNSRGTSTKGAVSEPYPKIFFQKGVNFTAEHPDIYGSKRADAQLRKLKSYGVDAIALVPYGFASENSVSIRFNLGWEKDSGVERLAEVAHRAGMRVLLKPQLYVRDGYPGSLEYPSPEERNEWFAQYRIFLEHYAMLATRIHADLLCVGVELDKLSKYTAEWRALIARARELYPGPLVYAANSGDEFESIQFWDALDYIGVEEYYSLPDSLSADEVVARVEAVQKRFQRPVIFTEAGFPSVEGGNRDPWEERAGKLSPQLQARCYEQIFRAFYHQPWFQGMYWWKVGTNGFGGSKDFSHTPWRKPAMEVVKRWYTKNER